MKSGIKDHVRGEKRKGTRLFSFHHLQGGKEGKKEKKETTSLTPIKRKGAFKGRQIPKRKKKKKGERHYLAAANRVKKGGKEKKGEGKASLYLFARIGRRGKGGGQRWGRKGKESNLFSPHLLVTAEKKGKKEGGGGRAIHSSSLTSQN